MRIKIKSTGMTIKEFLAVLQRVLHDNNITKIDTPNLYFGTCKRTIETSLRLKEIDIETREQEGFDQVAF